MLQTALDEIDLTPLLFETYIDQENTFAKRCNNRRLG